MSVISLTDYMVDKDCPELIDHSNFAVIIDGEERSIHTNLEDAFDTMWELLEDDYSYAS